MLNKKDFRVYTSLKSLCYECGENESFLAISISIIRFRGLNLKGLMSFLTGRGQLEDMGQEEFQLL